MTLYLSKGRAPLRYEWPLPIVIAGTTWASELRVFDENAEPAALGGYQIDARAVDRNDFTLAEADVSLPADGVIRWSFGDSAFANTGTECFRFILDAQTGGVTQRLMDSRLSVRGAGSTFATRAGAARQSAAVIVSDTAPTAPSQGTLWWNSTTGTLNVWFVDFDNTKQWVMVAGPPTG